MDSLERGRTRSRVDKPIGLRIALLIAPTIATVAGLAAATAVAAAGQEGTERADPWGPVRSLVGSWEASVAGESEAVRRCEWIMNERYVLCRASLVRPPGQASPAGDLHEELGLFSFDRERGKLVYRELVIEGFVNTYLCDAADGKLVCVTEAVENGAGVRARLTFEVADRFRFVERFEVAWPGKELEPYATNAWRRVPALPD